MKLDSVIWRLQDLLEEGVSPRVKVGYKYNDKINYIAPVTCFDDEVEFIYFSVGKYKGEVYKEDDLDNFLDNTIAHCNRCSYGNNWNCDSHECVLKVTPMPNCAVGKEINPLYDVEDIEYCKESGIVKLILSN